MSGDEAESDEQSEHWRDTQRLWALSDFLKAEVHLPRDPDGRLNLKSLVDHAAAFQEACEAVRRIASRS
jgi:hypothetical protein